LGFFLAAQRVHSKAFGPVLRRDRAATFDRSAHCVDELRQDAADEKETSGEPVAVESVGAKANWSVGD
jgi:hypothetical protein